MGLFGSDLYCSCVCVFVFVSQLCMCVYLCMRVCMHFLVCIASQSEGIIIQLQHGATRSYSGFPRCSRYSAGVAAVIEAQQLARCVYVGSLSLVRVPGSLTDGTGYSELYLELPVKSETFLRERESRY